MGYLNLPYTPITILYFRWKSDSSWVKWGKTLPLLNKHKFCLLDFAIRSPSSLSKISFQRVVGIEAKEQVEQMGDEDIDSFKMLWR